ncbi:MULTISPECIES: hypothetical protein [Paenibacillus]|jgi:hypothetical protein|nr:MULTISPECIES: hypothetical protein [Paenibacillus]KEO77242.1 hypothetical protein EL23_18555 [Paenibacillus polymyxa]MCH6189499.1 hypothetical protein [Paenibacillus polymyxa]UMY56837.1 hypothetical protein MLD56_10510 [Paenibacillus peoriae]WRL59922.1 hypothetical protein U3G77_17480 [Paenibacillus polymyxa]
MGFLIFVPQPSVSNSLPWNNAKKQRFGQLADPRFSMSISEKRPYSGLSFGGSWTFTSPKASARCPNHSAVGFLPILPAFLRLQIDSK